MQNGDSQRNDYIPYNMRMGIRSRNEQWTQVFGGIIFCWLLGQLGGSWRTAPKECATIWRTNEPYGCESVKHPWGDAQMSIARNPCSPNRPIRWNVTLWQIVAILPFWPKVLSDAAFSTDAMSPLRHVVLNARFVSPGRTDNGFAGERKQLLEITDAIAPLLPADAFRFRISQFPPSTQGPTPLRFHLPWTAKAVEAVVAINAFS